MSNTPPSPEQRKAFWRVAAGGAAVCLGVTAGGFFLGLSPAVAHLAERHAALDDLAGRRQKAAELSGELSVARVKLDRAARDVATLPLQLEPSTAINRRLNRLAEAAAAAGVTVNEMQPLPVVDGRHYQTIPIRVSGVGTYPACAAFLHALRTQFPDTAVDSIDAANPAPSREANNASFRIELAWHTMPGK